MSTTETAFRVDTLRRGIQERDSDALLDLYADDAELRIVDRTNTPSSPLVLSGKESIGQYLGEISARDMTHEVTSVVVGDSSVAYVEECRYPDGNRVTCVAVLELAGGRIARHIGAQAWDE